MIPASPSVYKCPHCGALKAISAITSGNSIGATYWSDFKRDLPMSPRSSFVQQCPLCGKFFLLIEDNFYKCADSFFCVSSRGCLSYHSLKNAFTQLSPLGQYEKMIRLMLLHSYNDLYGDKLIADIPTEDRKLFKENATALIGLCDIDHSDDRLFIAELYREMGKFHKTISILRASFKYENEAQNNLCNKMLEYAEQKITNVFIYIGDEALSRKAIEVDDKSYLYDEKDDAEYNNPRRFI